MRFRSLIAAVALCAPGVVALAEPVTYTLSGSFDGSLNGVSFSGTAATFTFVTDTSNIQSPASGFYLDNTGVGTVTIDGFGTATFTSPTFGVLASNGTNGAIGFLDGTFAVGLINPGDSSVETYMLTAPFTANGYFSQGFLGATTAEGTTLGDLYITAGDDTNPTETFQATPLGVTPEPSSLLLLATGLLSVGSVVKRRFA